MAAHFSKKMLLIINPVSGKKAIVHHIPEIISTFQDAGYMCTTLITEHSGDGTEFASRLAKDYDMVVCTGGDGSLNEVVTGLLRADVKIPVGYIPCGSTNDFAATHSLDTDIHEAAKSIVSGRTSLYDVGTFGENSFTYVAAFGAFSWLSYTTDQTAKNILGRTAYFIDGVKDLPKIKPIHMKITADGTEYEDEYLFGAVCNSVSVAGVFELPESLVDTDDGKFELLLIKNPKNIVELDETVNGMLTQNYSCENIILTQARNILIENPEGVAFSLDGEKSSIYDRVQIGIKDSFLQLMG